MRRWTGFVIALIFSTATIWSANDSSRCHAFINYDFIWTLEMIPDRAGGATPILNIVTLRPGEWDLRPEQIHLFNSRGLEAEIDRFSIETGEEPYLTHFLKVHGDSFIGLDLVGDFQGFEEVENVSVDLGDVRYVLQPVDCLDFEVLVDRVNLVNFDSPDVREDYTVLGIELIGRIEPRPY